MVFLGGEWKSFRFLANVCPLGQVQTIPAAFTRNDKARIDAFVEGLRKSESDLTDFDQKWQSFNRWYFQEKLRVWYSLVAQVKMGSTSSGSSSSVG